MCRAADAMLTQAQGWTPGIVDGARGGILALELLSELGRRRSHGGKDCRRSARSWRLCGIQGNADAGSHGYLALSLRTCRVHVSEYTCTPATGVFFMEEIELFRLGQLQGETQTSELNSSSDQNIPCKSIP